MCQTLVAYLSIYRCGDIVFYVSFSTTDGFDEIESVSSSKRQHPAMAYICNKIMHMRACDDTGRLFRDLTFLYSTHVRCTVNVTLSWLEEWGQPRIEDLVPGFATELLDPAASALESLSL